MLKKLNVPSPSSSLDRGTVLKVGCTVLVASVFAGCAAAPSEQGSGPDQPSTRGRRDITALGTVGSGQCAAGQIEAIFHWSADPRYDNVSFIRNPGRITRCVVAELARIPPPGATVGLIRRDGDLVAVDAPLAPSREPRAYPAKREPVDCPSGQWAVSYRGWAPPPVPGSTRHLPYALRVDCLPSALKRSLAEGELVEVSRLNGTLTIVGTVHRE